MPQTDIITTPTRRFQCRHIFTGGHRCGSPSLRHEDFCFYHRGLHARQTLHTVDLSQGEHHATPFTLPIPEDRSAIQQAIGEILNRLAGNELDPRRAGLLLYGLQIASINLPRAAPAAAGEQGSPIEEITTDPTLGPIAPRTELPDPDAPPKNSLVARLLEELQRNNPPATNPPETPKPPDPVILSEAEESRYSASPATSAPGDPNPETLSSEPEQSEVEGPASPTTETILPTIQAAADSGRQLRRAREVVLLPPHLAVVLHRALEQLVPPIVKLPPMLPQLRHLPVPQRLEAP